MKLLGTGYHHIQENELLQNQLSEDLSRQLEEVRSFLILRWSKYVNNNYHYHYCIYSIGLATLILDDQSIWPVSSIVFGNIFQNDFLSNPSLGGVYVEHQGKNPMKYFTSFYITLQNCILYIIIFLIKSQKICKDYQLTKTFDMTKTSPHHLQGSIRNSDLVYQ